MNIWNKVLVGFIIIASLAMFVMASRALNTHKHWRSIAQKQEAAIAEAEQLQKVLKGDTNELDAPLGIRQLKIELRKLLVDRGRVWRNCQPGKVIVSNNGNTVDVPVTTDLPDPNGIAAKTVVYVFEETSITEGGGYLGEFTVAAVAEADKVLQLEPTMSLYNAQLQKLQISRGPWTLYEMMPLDQHEILLEMAEDEIRAMFSDSTEEQYVADLGLEVAEAPGDAEPKKPARQLRDYAVIFQVQHDHYTALRDDISGAESDISYLQSALADARQQEQFRNIEIDVLKQKLAVFAKERNDVSTHGQSVYATLAAVNAGIERIAKSNQSLVAAIAQIQWEATQRIDAQTRSMAQAAPGG